MCDLQGMHSQDLAIVTGLVSVAWADGRVADSETQVIDALLEAFQATPSEARQIRRYAQTPRTLDERIAALRYDTAIGMPHIQLVDNTPAVSGAATATSTRPRS